jgi:hypothetical protein
LNIVTVDQSDLPVHLESNEWFAFVDVTADARTTMYLAWKVPGETKLADDDYREYG